MVHQKSIQFSSVLVTEMTFIVCTISSIIRGVSDEWQLYLLPDSVHLNTHMFMHKHYQNIIPIAYSKPYNYLS